MSSLGMAGSLEMQLGQGDCVLCAPGPHPADDLHHKCYWAGNPASHTEIQTLSIFDFFLPALGIDSRSPP